MNKNRTSMIGETPCLVDKHIVFCNVVKNSSATKVKNSKKINY